MWTYISQSEMELYHHGILGMRWGRKNGPPYPLGAGDHSASEKKAGWRKSLDGGSGSGGTSSRKVRRMAKKDAKRYADAKMYYGEGAGTRRKLLNAELDRKKKDPEYKKAFDEYVENANYALSAKKAVRERKTRDGAAKAKRILKRYGIPAAGFAGGLYYVTHKSQIDSMVVGAMDSAVKKAGMTYQRYKTNQFIKRATR